jgi:predicted metalloprotease
MRPFYCPIDQKVYLDDTSFFQDLQQRFGACALYRFLKCDLGGSQQT